MRWLYATPSSATGRHRLAAGVQEVTGADAGSDLAARAHPKPVRL